MTDVFRFRARCPHTRQDNLGKLIRIHVVFEYALIQKFYRASDLYMKGIQNAKERDSTDWEQLFKSVDPRFKILEIKSPKGSYLSLICAIWEGEDTY